MKTTKTKRNSASARKRSAVEERETARFREMLQNHNGRPRNTTSNLHTILEHHPEFKGTVVYDDFSAKLRVVKALPRGPQVPPSVQKHWVVRDATDNDFEFIRRWLSSEFEINVSANAVFDALRAITSESPRHQVRDYLTSLQWDGVPRVSTLFPNYFSTAHTHYTRRCGEILLISAVARAFQPGCKVDTMCVLKGAQGAGKSTAIRVLSGESWFSDTAISLKTKDGLIAMLGKWFIEFAELASLHGTNSEAIKTFISSGTDTYRPPYSKVEARVPRHCILVGTTNNDTPLIDTSGNRRFLTMAVRTVNIAELQSDRDQLWAEAVHLYQSGTAWYPNDPEFEREAAEIAGEQIERDPWSVRVNTHLDSPLHHDQFVRAGISTPEILDEVLRIPLKEQTRRDSQRVNDVMKFRKDFERARKGTGTGRVFKFYKISSDVDDLLKNADFCTQNGVIPTDRNPDAVDVLTPPFSPSKQGESEGEANRKSARNSLACMLKQAGEVQQPDSSEEAP